MIENNYIAFKCNSNVFSAKSVSSASCQWLVCRHMHIVFNIFGGAYVFGCMRSFSQGVLLGLIFAGYVPLASQTYPIIVYSVAIL